MFCGERLTLDAFDRLVLRALKAQHRDELARARDFTSHYSVTRRLYDRPQSKTFDNVLAALRRLQSRRFVTCAPLTAGMFRATAKGRRAR